MTYRINEFQFQLPDAELQDTSINILKFSKFDTTLIISRSFLADDETLHTNVDSQIKRLEQQVTDLRCQPPQTLHLGAKKEVEAIELHSQFSKASDRVYQYQLVLVIPGTRNVLALSYVRPKPLGDTEMEHWTEIKRSLAFGGIE